MNYSVQAYLKRCATITLLSFLETCMLYAQWEQYAPVIPQVFAELNNRDVVLPGKIYASWEAFIIEKTQNTTTGQ